MAARLVVIDTLCHVDCLIKPKAATSRFGRDFLTMLAILVREPEAISIRSAWTPAKGNEVFINTDGSIRKGHTAVAAGARDCNGMMLGATFGPVGSGSAIEPEIWMLNTGLTWSSLLKHLMFRSGLT